MELKPAWLPYESDIRFGVGLEFNCPMHEGCRVAVYFANPVDGGEPDAPHGVALYHVLHPLFHQMDGGLGSISLWPEIDAGPHGQFSIVRGTLLRRLH